MVKGHRIKSKVSVADFVENVGFYEKESIKCSPHAFFRLSEKQRKIFTCEELESFITEKIPIFVGIQYNGFFAVFYKYKKKKILRIILEINPQKIEIITFYFVEKHQIPKIK